MIEIDQAVLYQSLREAQGQVAAFSPRFNLVYEYQSLREAQGQVAAAKRLPLPTGRQAPAGRRGAFP